MSRSTPSPLLSCGYGSREATPVREALIRLSHESLVTVSVGRPTKVAELDFSRAAHQYDLGGLLDGYAAHLAASAIEPEALARMRKLLDEMAAEQNVARVQTLDEEFHRVYYLAAGAGGGRIELAQRRCRGEADQLTHRHLAGTWPAGGAMSLR